MKYRLYFFPYAGGARSTFMYWKNIFAPEIELEVIELPGRGKNMMKPKYADMNEAAEDICAVIEKRQSESNVPYYMAGHCMGAVLAFETARKISERNNISVPQRIFISGHGAPDNTTPAESWKELDNKQLLEKLVATGMLPEEILEMPELAEMLAENTHDDSVLYENYIYDISRPPLDVKLSVFAADDDEKVTFEDAERWKDFVSAPPQMIKCSGGHYFLKNGNEYTDTVKKIIFDEWSDNNEEK